MFDMECFIYFNCVFEFFMFFYVVFVFNWGIFIICGIEYDGVVGFVFEGICVFYGLFVDLFDRCMIVKI